MRRMLVATIFCLYGGTAFAQLPASEELGSRVDAIAKQMLTRPVAGISVAVARDGQVVIARGYGMALRWRMVYLPTDGSAARMAR